MNAHLATQYTPYVRDLSPQVNSAATWSMQTNCSPDITFRLWSQSRGEWLETSSEFVERTLIAFTQMRNQLPDHDIRISFTIYLPDVGKIVDATEHDIHAYLPTEVKHASAAA